MLLGCDPDLHYYPESVEKIYDFAFVGNYHSRFMEARIDYMDTLCKNFKEFYIGNCSFLNMAKKYKQAKFVFNYSINKDINMRIFEAMCSGSLLLTDWYPELDETGLSDFVISYKTKEDMLTKAKESLDASWREGVARKAREVVLANHTYLHRAKQMMETICG